MANTLPAVEVTSQWQSLNSLSGIEIGQRMTVDNFGPTIMLIAVSDTMPTSNNYGISVEPYEPVSIRAGESEIWARTVPLGTRTYASCQDGVTVSPVNSLASTIAKFSSLKADYVRSLSVSTNEVYTAEGLRFDFSFDNVFTALQTIILVKRLPADADVVAAFDQRALKSLNGSCDVEIIWDATINEADIGAELTVYNEYKDNPNVNQMKIYNLAAYTDGETRDTDFVPGTGSGSNSAGSASPGKGYRLYGPGNDIVIVLRNLENAANRIRFDYGWIEFPISIAE